MTKVVNRLFLIVLLGVVVVFGHFYFKGDSQVDNQVYITKSAPVRSTVTTLQTNDDDTQVRGISKAKANKTSFSSNSSVDSFVSGIGHKGSAEKGPITISR